MLRFRWLPWRYIIRRAARSHGFLDPLSVLAHLRRFSQPSEVQEPIELVRAGMVFHARGLVNSRAIQNNLDWVWPYWVERQFNPRDLAFVPRAFSFSHINLTHRNWTAVGLPDCGLYPLIDPRGLQTPCYDGWSIDFWVQLSDGRMLYPSRAETAQQSQEVNGLLSCSTSVRALGGVLHSQAWLERNLRGCPVFQSRVECDFSCEGVLYVAIRPYNPEGIHFVESIQWSAQERAFTINDHATLRLGLLPQRVLFSNYYSGDLSLLLQREDTDPSDGVQCSVGMATAAAAYPFKPDRALSLRLEVPLEDGHAGERCPDKKQSWQGWADVLPQGVSLRGCEHKFASLHAASLQTLLLLSAGETVPGPYTYRRFWFRDACLMLHALACSGYTERVWQQVMHFPSRQRRDGYFHSQEGEWDANGQVLWLINRLRLLSNQPVPERLKKSLIKGADWIVHKRVQVSAPVRHAGLFPPGFSAEHLGPNDYYYWDDFWGIAGLQAAAEIARSWGEVDLEQRMRQHSEAFMTDVEASIAQIPPHISQGAIPASPYRRLDAGAVGSMVADYPLQLWPKEDPRIEQTLEFLLHSCTVKDGFFQDMVHSGINAYLTLDLAQTLLRRGDRRFWSLVCAVAKLASPTGHWPEAIHPHTEGGCMGDGQHGWAAAEWLMMMRSLFLREEEGRLIIGSGLAEDWWQTCSNVEYGPTLTPWGSVRVRLSRSAQTVSGELYGEWHTSQVPPVEINVPGYASQHLSCKAGKNTFTLTSSN